MVHLYFHPSSPNLIWRWENLVPKSGDDFSDPSLANPTTSDLIAAKRILRYLKGTMNLGITYSTSTNEDIKEDLYAYSDASYAGCKITRKSTTGYVVLYANAAISWRSHKQSTIALSSTEAEYMASCDASQEFMYLRMLFSDLGHLKDGPTLLFQDNQGSIRLAEDFNSTKRTKHIDVKYHFIRKQVEKKRIFIDYIPTSDMVADCLTKPVGKVILERCRAKMLGLPCSN